MDKKCDHGPNYIQGQKGKVTYIQGILLILDILLNFVTMGSYGETISSKVGKSSLMQKPRYIFLEKYINTLFNSFIIPKRWRFEEHCFYAIDWEVGLDEKYVSEYIYKKYVETKDKKYADSLKKMGFTLHEMQY